MAQERTDEELLAAYQQGDPGAFESLLRRYRAPLYTFLLRMLGDREKAEDLAQETFLRIVKGASGWEHRARFQTWLFTIARNLCVDQSRRDRFRRADSLDAEGRDGEPPLVESVPGAGIDPERGAASAKVRPLLQKALLSLPAEQREVFILREQAGVPFREIAEMTGVNENTVKSRMRYALEGLRKALAAAGVPEDEAAPEPAPGIGLGRA
ncbi:MAG TPA: RNA polymerase sigma factor [Myxococcales bacterium]|jgi:RNA polymerase sigma-70 factor (ECF subfamily)|nr:RNA polymerase sigma factor [Myxococcales bacterium]